MMYSLRSSASVTVTPRPRPIKTWRMTGSIFLTDSPRPLLSLGTSRQPSRICPSSLIERSISYSQANLDAGSCGRNTMPTPYWPAAGSLIPCFANSSRKRASGICSNIPAPSPASGSAPTAPRWVRFLRICKPCSTMACDFAPLMCATKPTPQASCSLAGSYNPWAQGGCVTGYLAGKKGRLKANRPEFAIITAKPQKYTDIGDGLQALDMP